MKDIEGIKYYSPIEEKINIISHAIGLILSIVALVLLVTHATQHGDVWHIVSFSIFGASLINNTFEPNPENRKIYDQLFAEFLNIYKHNKAIFKRLNSTG